LKNIAKASLLLLEATFLFFFLILRGELGFCGASIIVTISVLSSILLALSFNMAIERQKTQ
jgi:hypothetical protein